MSIGGRKLLEDKGGGRRRVDCVSQVQRFVTASGPGEDDEEVVEDVAVFRMVEIQGLQLGHGLRKIALPGQLDGSTVFRVGIGGLAEQRRGSAKKEEQTTAQKGEEPLRHKNDNPAEMRPFGPN